MSRYNQNFKIQDFNVLDELNHNEVGNPHTQYVGTNRDTLLKPAYDLNLPALNQNTWWKIATFTLNKSDKRNLTLCFDLFDEYNGLIVNRSEYELNIYPSNEPTNSTAYYPNGIYKRIQGTNYERVFVEEIINSDTDIKCAIYVKNIFQYNFPKIAIRYLNTNILDFNLINNGAMTGTTPIGNLYSNVPNISVLNTSKTTQDGYYKLAHFNFNFNEAMTVYELEINVVDTNANKVAKSTNIVFQAYNNGVNTGGYTATKFYLKNNVNFKIDDIVMVINGKQFELFVKVKNNDRASIRLVESLDYSNRGNREISIQNYGFVTELPTGTVYKPRATLDIFIDSSEDNKTYDLQMKNYNLSLLDNNGDTFANMVKAQTQSNFTATTVEDLVSQLNAFLVKLKTAQVIK